MTNGPVMLDLAGPELAPEERELLQHPAVGGVILFSRNYHDPEQLERLTAAIHAARRPALLIAVDQEGGRVQRFRDGFTRLPPTAWFGELHDHNPKHAFDVARQVGWLMASELRAAGVDFSFAPVLDRDRGISAVIGDRAFHEGAGTVAELAHSWMRGVHEAGMAAVGKHFPGHGSVAEDSHTDLPIDRRRFEDILMDDLLPFERMIYYGLEAIMPAHVIYEQVDPKAASFSRFWLQEVLRGRLEFQGVVFSDDLNMQAAGVAGGFGDRARAALEAGCDTVLVCNNRTGAESVLDELKGYDRPASHVRLMRMHGRHPVTRAELHEDPRWQAAVRAVAQYEESPSLSLDL